MITTFSEIPSTENFAQVCTGNRHAVFLRHDGTVIPTGVEDSVTAKLLAQRFALNPVHEPITKLIGQLYVHRNIMTLACVSGQEYGHLEVTDDVTWESIIEFAARA